MNDENLNLDFELHSVSILKIYKKVKLIGLFLLEGKRRR